MPLLDLVVDQMRLSLCLQLGGASQLLSNVGASVSHLL